MLKPLTAKNLEIRTDQKVQAVDITSKIRSAMPKLTNGLLNIFCPHTTAGLLINEAETGLMKDIEKVAQTPIGDSDFQHDRIDNNARAHLTVSFLTASLVIPVSGGNLTLGTWQSVIFLEMDGPRNRRVTLYGFGE